MFVRQETSYPVKISQIKSPAVYCELACVCRCRAGWSEIYEPQPTVRVFPPTLCGLSFSLFVNEFY